MESAAEDGLIWAQSFRIFDLEVMGSAVSGLGRSRTHGGSGRRQSDFVHIVVTSKQRGLAKKSGPTVLGHASSELLPLPTTSQ